MQSVSCLCARPVQACYSATAYTRLGGLSVSDDPFSVCAPKTDINACGTFVTHILVCDLLVRALCAGTLQNQSHGYINWNVNLMCFHLIYMYINVAVGVVQILGYSASDGHQLVLIWEGII